MGETGGHTIFFELREALAGPECAICALVRRGITRYLNALAHEGVGDERTRAIIRAARGFCADHGRMLLDARDALGTAIVHRDVLANLTRDLAAAQHRLPNLEHRLRRALRRGPQGPQLGATRGCTACEQRRSIEDVYLGGLVQHLSDGSLTAAAHTSTGLCVPHLRAAMARAPDGAAFERLRAAQMAAWARLADELDEFIRKQDYRFKHEPSGGESDSWQRAVTLIAGEPGLSAPPPED